MNGMMLLARLFNNSITSMMVAAGLTASAIGCLMASSKSSFSIEWSLSQVSSSAIVFPLYLDVFSLTFVATVSFITSAVLTFSKSYMSLEKHFLRFHLLVLSFVASMLLLILSPNLMSVLVGWDGLGVTSYLLVIYFQSSKSYNAGLLTALTNRVGDVMILMAIAFCLSTGGWNFGVWAKDLPPSSLGLVALLLMAAAMTKSAQVPFSAWLPAAMAAPTPVSSLVHSSTLVTAGVYLLFRFSDFIATSLTATLLLHIGVFTMIMAGASALYELDMKKIVALSTLSQLGLMMATLGLGLYEIAFFHMVAHAFFKALLFMSVGNMIHLSSDFQDLRKIGLSESCFPTTLAFSLVANWSLCGLPFLSGFYSKDMILEMMLMTSTNPILALLFYSAVSLTVAYTVRFIILTSMGGLMNSGSIVGADNDNLMNLSMAALWPLAIAGGSGLTWLLFIAPGIVSLPEELKLLAFLVIFLTGVLAFVQISAKEKTTSSFSSWTWGMMWTLPMTGVFLWNLSQMSASKWLRRLDLTWTPVATLTSAMGAMGASSASLFSSHVYFFMVFGLTLFSLGSIIFIYLRILKLFNP